MMIIYNIYIYIYMHPFFGGEDSWRNGSAFDSRSKGCLFKS